ncbi:unnamed protein product [Echinostoma caproni]|uniref:FAM184 domain-containing protein n=1 Tax=Echinostoma caproni TaxID=27848 RepID=A0A183A6J7_9TREM|nr:unnamed protein product [Echinostoma caproni]
MPAATNTCPNGYPTTLSQDDPLPSHVHYRMSKKIAQLTKVIYILNTKNDEIENAVTQMTQLRQCEIERLRCQYAAKMMRYEELLEEEIENRTKISQLEASLEQARSRCEKGEAILKLSTEKSEQTQKELKVNYEAQLTKLKEALLKTQEDHLRGTQLAEETIRSWKEHQCPDIEPIREEKCRLERELEAVSRAKEELEETLDTVRREIAGDFQHQITRLSSELSAKQDIVGRQERTIEVLTTKLIKVKEDLVRTCELEEARKKILIGEIQRSTEEECSAKWNGLMEQEISRYKEELDETRHILKNSQQQFEENRLRLEKELEQEKNKNNELRSKHELVQFRLLEDNQSLTEQVLAVQGELLARQEEWGKTAAQYSAEKCKLQTENGAIRIQIKTLEKQMANLKKTVNGNDKNDKSQIVKNLEEEKSHLEEEISQLSTQLTASQNLLKTNKAEYRNALFRLTDHVKKKSTPSDFIHMQEVERLKRLVKKLTAEYQAEKVELVNQLEKSSTFTDLTAQLDRKWAETVARECSRVREETREKLADAFERKTQSLIDQNTRQMVEVENEYRKQIDHLLLQLHAAKLDAEKLRPESQDLLR